MPRFLVIGIAAVVVLAGVGYGAYRIGWWPGANTADTSTTFEQSQVNELQQDVSDAATVSKDMATATADGKQVYLDQGHDIVVQACTTASTIPQLPADLTAFVKQNCSNGEIAATSEFYEPSDNASSTADPDPGAN